MCTGNENSKPIWNKFIIRKDIIETSQVVLNLCRTVQTVWIYKWDNQKLYIEGQTIQWSKDRRYNGQKTDDTMVKINRTNKALHRKLTIDQPELRWSERVSSSCSISDTRRVTIKWHEHHIIWTSCWILV